MKQLVALGLLAFALTFVAQASPQASVMKAPGGLHAFLLRADEQVQHSYPRTPSFTWQPVSERGGHYQFELATSRGFDDGSIVFKDTKVSIPAETVGRQLPWMTGSPYALWAHVRWISDNGLKATQWSQPFGFNMRWRDEDVPKALPAPEGLVRWAPIQGATAYQVLYPDLVPAVAFETTTNVADEREFFTFHSALGYGTIHWRVRAIRNVGQDLSATNGLPAVSYGPWSPTFTTVNAPQTPGALKPTDTVSDVWDAVGGAGRAHGLTPGFAWTPTAPVVSQGIDPGSPLYRVYIFTDNHCVNRVFTGSIVGSPAFAPRTEGGPMPLPGDTATLAQNEIAPPFLTGPGSESSALDATGAAVVSNETAGSQVGPSGTTASGSKSSPSSSSSSAAPALAGVDLWDSGWPSGRYYWTVVPVSVETPPAKTQTTTTTATSSAPAAPAAGGPISYHDMAVPQDSCEAGLGMSFGKVSKPVVAAAGKPYLSGVQPSSRMVAAAGKTAVVLSSPIVAWEPAVGATMYQVELSRSAYPWQPSRHVTTPSTSVTLPLTKYDVGTWYYRVRGINDALPVGARRMTWSRVLRVTVTGDRFAVVGG